MNNKENAGDCSTKKGVTTRSASKKAQAQREPLVANNPLADSPTKQVAEQNGDPKEEPGQPLHPAVPAAKEAPKEFSFKTPGKARRVHEDESPSDDPDTPKISGKAKTSRPTPYTNPKNHANPQPAKSALSFSTTAAASPPKNPENPKTPSTSPKASAGSPAVAGKAAFGKDSPPSRESFTSKASDDIPSKPSESYASKPSSEGIPGKSPESYVHPQPPRTPPRTPNMMGRPGFMPSPGGYGGYAMPPMGAVPLYPPYTPHPVFFDPSGQFSRPGSAYHSQHGGSTYSSRGLFGEPVFPYHHPPCASPIRPHPGYVPPFEGPQMQERPTMPMHPREAWRMHMNNTPGMGGEAPNPAHNPSVHQMTSMCFQAASKGSLARLPRSAVRTLVQHQLQAQGPVHAPWYRGADSRHRKALPDAAPKPTEQSEGTGVFVPKS